jgi:hypothetical protein
MSDVFISYAREDSSLAEALLTTCTRKASVYGGTPSWSMEAAPREEERPFANCAPLRLDN